MHLKKWIPVILTLFVFASGYLYLQQNDTDAGKTPLKGLKFYTNLEPALEEAKEKNKTIFVYIRSEYCHWCKRFEEESFTNQSIIKTLNENFILVSLDADKQRKEIRDFRVRGTPTEIFLDPEGAEIKRIPGYVDNGTFLNVIGDLAK